jgi:putative toxin-antitoxin system antitoxin component (TIGR02293 family)
MLCHMNEVTRIASILGIPGASRRTTPMHLVQEVEKGLPFSSLARVFKQVAPDEPALRYRVVSRATIARKEASGARLSIEQGDHVARLARVWALALEVWKKPAEARTFLLQPHAMLDDRRPIDVALTTEGARLVEGILGRLLYGSAA